MFCTECGHAVQGKFCGECGAAVVKEPLTAEVLPDWREEVRYDLLLQYPAVRLLIEQHTERATKRMTGEQFLALADKIIPQPVSMEGVAIAAKAALSHLGIRTDKHRQQFIPAPVGEVLVRTLCSLAQHGHTLRKVTQAANGCVFSASLPSDFLSLEGDLLVAIHCRNDASQPFCTELQATATIQGQWFDWGKNSRSLDRLFRDIAATDIATLAILAEPIDVNRPIRQAS